MDADAIAKIQEAIKQAISQGKSLDEVKDFMKQAGYSEEDVNQAVSGLQPAPEPTPAAPASTAPVAGGGLGNKKPLLILIIIAVIVAMAAFLLMGSGPAPTTTPGAPVPSTPTTPTTPTAPTAPTEPSTAAEYCDLSKVDKVIVVETTNDKDKLYTERTMEYEMVNGEIDKFYVDGEESNPDMWIGAALIDASTCRDMDLSYYQNIYPGHEDGNWFKATALMGDEEYWARYQFKSEGGKQYFITESRDYSTLFGTTDPTPEGRYQEIWVDTAFNRKQIDYYFGEPDLTANPDNLDTTRTVEEMLQDPSVEYTIKEYTYI